MMVAMLFILLAIVSLLAITGVHMYSSKSHVAQEQDNSTVESEACPQTNTPFQRLPDTLYNPITASPVNSLGDFEENMIFQNESDRELSTGLRYKLMSQYPMDWSGLPPSSAQFQAGLRETFEDASGDIPTEPIRGSPVYSDMENSNMMPPDTLQMDANERKLLQTYIPRNVADKTTYDIDDAREFIHKIYEEKGLIPDVIHEDGSQVYEVVGVRKKDEKIVYEDELDATASREPNSASGEATIHVSPNAFSMNSGENDPFFDKMNRTRTDKWDYTKFTPGLERMFAPTYATENWY
jgi:hypothetical protein